MGASPGEITRLLNEVRNGNRSAEAKLLPLVYQDLHRRAANYMRRERADHTLQPTALVHEAYIRLVDQRRILWHDRSHFFAIAAIAMRNVLIDYARKENAQRRGGETNTISLDKDLVFSPQKSSELLALDDALTRLAKVDRRQSQIVELRYFGGLSVEETAAALGLSKRQVERDWAMAKVWLHAEVTKHD
jgi:RNA polymerase sigma factor (TIGR02999 family)